MHSVIQKFCGIKQFASYQAIKIFYNALQEKTFEAVYENVDFKFMIIGV